MVNNTPDLFLFDRLFQILKMKIDKQTKSQLIELSNRLPLVWVSSHEKQILTKDELEEIGYVGAEEFEPGKFIYKSPVQIAKNHFRAMRKAYLNYGVKGIEHYIDKINKLPAL
jgi:hypothetical protein